MNRPLINFYLVCSMLVGLHGCGGGGGSATLPSLSPLPTAVNVAPVANAGGNQNLPMGSTVTLNGSASTHANSNALSFTWVLSAKPAGSVAVLNGAASVTATFIADVEGTYIVTLVVSDGKTNSVTTTVNVVASHKNIAPIANAGPNQNLPIGSAVTLDGSASTDANADALTYAWTLSSKPTGSASALNGATTIKPTFVADAAGTYIATLIVNDGKSNSAASTVTINVAAGNATPIANAGNAQSVAIGLVNLDGSASTDADGDPLTYSWTLISRPAGSAAVLVNASSVKSTFTADLVGSYVASLVVRDGKVNSATATVTITATLADAWQSQTAHKIFTALAVASDDTNNPMRGYYRWRNQELVPQVNPPMEAYQRYRWKDLESTQGVYNFATLLSDRQTAVNQGKKFAFRLQAMLGYDDGQIYLPAYLVGHTNCAHACGWWTTSNPAFPGKTFMPDWNDAFVQQRASALLQALASALGNTDDLAWIDIGLFGQWGEWAISPTILYPSATGIVTPTDASKQAFIDMHLNNFPQRQLVMFAVYQSYQAIRYATLLQTITTLPVGLRIDCLGKVGFMNQWTNHPTEWGTLQNQWQRAPFVSEYCPFSSGDTTTNAATALQQISDFHITNAGNGNLAAWASFIGTEQQQLLQVGRQAGYRNRVDVADITLSASGSLSVTATIRNDGNAPTYEPWDVMLELSNPTGAVVWTQKMSGNLSTLLGSGAGQSYSGIFQLPTLGTDTYSLKLIARDSRRLTASNVRAPLKWTNTERNGDGGVTLAILKKN